ncbi:MAG TPA: hypothetical protein ENJ00_02925 [Phycisphaerales bacterium]|nr:hypothetical protein [Phycisphaerales bacterium]
MIRAATIGVLIVVLLGVFGCTYQKEVAANPFFSGIEGAKLPDVPRENLGRGFDPTSLPLDQQRIENEDGSITLQARSPRHLMRHIYETLHNGEKDLFLEQVLSNATKQEFIDHDTPPEQAYEMLLEHLDDMDKLFARMPMAQNTPNAMLLTIGPGMHRLKLVQGVGRDLLWQGFDMIFEDGNERLLWFYQQQ